MLFAIALGGAAGSVLRYGIGSVLERHSGAFPFGTMLVNVTGSLLLGALVSTLHAASPELRAGLTVGLCGGYTTFSTFGLETVRLLEAGRWMSAAAYVLASVLLSLLATLAGLMLGRAAMPT